MGRVLNTARLLRAVLLGGVVALALPWILPPSAVAQNDQQLLRERITGDGAGAEHYRLSDLVPPLGGDNEAWIAERRALASRMAQRELTDALESLEDTDSVLGAMERLRHTDFSLTGPRPPMAASGEAAAGGQAGFGVRLRLSETVRLRVSNGGLSRDIFYDVMGHRAWVELYGAQLKDGRTGLSLTNEYLGDEDVARVLFTIRHNWQ